MSAVYFLFGGLWHLWAIVPANPASGPEGALRVPDRPMRIEPVGNELPPVVLEVEAHA